MAGRGKFALLNAAGCALPPFSMIACGADEDRASGAHLRRPHLSGIDIEEYHARGNEQALESVSQ
jgi:hypothetical protein